MELRQLTYFLTVAETLHFGQAATQLHISQPPLTVHIQRLERELGVPLFHRTSRRVSLTAEGAYFRERVEAVFRDLDDAVDEVRDVHAGRRGRVRVGFVSSASYQLMPAVVRDLRRTSPGIRVDLHPLTTGEQLEALLEGQLDVGILRDAPVQTGLRIATVLTEQMVAVLPAAHPLTEHREVSPEDLITEPMILFPYQSMPGYITQVMGVFRNLGCAPTVVQRAVNQENVMGLISAGVGISILPASLSAFSIPGVEARPITTHPKSRLEVATSHTPVSPATKAFVTMLHAVAKNVQVNNCA